MKPKMSLISSNIHGDIPSKFANNTSQIISFEPKKILHKFYIIFFKQTNPSIQSKYDWINLVWLDIRIASYCSRRVFKDSDGDIFDSKNTENGFVGVVNLWTSPDRNGHLSILFISTANQVRKSMLLCRRA